METQTAPATPITSFADQVKQATTSKSYRNAEETMQGSPDTPILPAGAPQAPSVQPLPKALTPEETKKAKIKIGMKEFGSYEEAIAYAEREAAKAQGVQETLDKLNKPQEPPAQPEPAFEDELEELIFTKPKEAIKKLYDKAKEDAKKEMLDWYTGEQTKQQQESARQKAWSAHWDNFYQSNQDLTEFKDVVDYVTEKKWADVADIPVNEANEIIAAESRKLLRLQKEAALPSKTLPSSPAIVASSTSGNIPQGSDTTVKSVLDFISQVNKHRKRSK